MASFWPSRISRREALRIAEEECARRGLAWVEPVNVTGGLLSYHIMTNANRRGGNINVHIRAWGGRVTSVRFARY